MYRPVKSVSKLQLTACNKIQSEKSEVSLDDLNNDDSGTFQRLGIRESNSGNNILQPLARRLENTHLSPIHQTPPKMRPNIIVESERNLGKVSRHLINDTYIQDNTNASHLPIKNKGMEKKVSFIDRTKSTLRQAVSFARRITPSPAVLANGGKEEQQNKDTSQIAKNRFSANDKIEDPRHELGMGAHLSHATSITTKPDDSNTVYNLNTVEETSHTSIVDETEPVKLQFRDELTPGSKRSSNNIRRQSPGRNNERFLYPTNIDTDKDPRIQEKISDQTIEAKASIANQSTPKPDRRYGDPGCTVDSPKIQSLNKKALVSYEISTKSVKKKLESSKPENN